MNKLRFPQKIEIVKANFCKEIKNYSIHNSITVNDYNNKKNGGTSWKKIVNPLDNDKEVKSDKLLLVESLIL